MNRRKPKLSDFDKRSIATAKLHYEIAERQRIRDAIKGLRILKLLANGAAITNSLWRIK